MKALQEAEETSSSDSDDENAYACSPTADAAERNASFQQHASPPASPSRHYVDELTLGEAGRASPSQARPTCRFHRERVETYSCGFSDHAHPFASRSLLLG